MIGIPECIAGTKHESAIIAILQAALDAVNPTDIVERSITVTKETLTIAKTDYDLVSLDRIIGIGVGKGAQTMVRGLSNALGNRIDEGVAVVKQNETDPSIDTHPIEVIEGSHPALDSRSRHAADRILLVARSLGQNDLAVVLISGGASSLVALPAPGVSLDDLKTATVLLIRSGIDIEALNTVRRHLSSIKGGRLAEALSPARVHTLILSDVIGNDPSAVGSGLTTPDSTTFQDAWDVLDRAHVLHRLPESVVNHLAKGVGGGVPENPTRDHPVFKSVKNDIIGSNSHAVSGAAQAAKRLKFDVETDESLLRGEAKDFGKRLVAHVNEMKSGKGDSTRPSCLVLGGETTVTVTGSGKGGRNQELALSAAIELDGIENTLVVSFATDGTDGPTDCAGAMVTGGTCHRARGLGLDPRQFLRNNNSYELFDALGDHIKTGPTLTNVADLLLVFVF